MSSADEHDELGLNAVTLVKHNLGAELAIQPDDLQMLVIGNGSFATHPLPDVATITIGRSPDCEISINHSSVSRRHATLAVDKNAITLEDLGSVNGTFVRGAKLEPKHPATITIGELVLFGETSVVLQRRARPTRARRLLSHDYFEARLEEECGREERTGVSFALMRIHFERRAPATFIEETLGELLRESDLLGKYAPNEYGVLLPDMPATKACDVVKRIERKLLEHGLKTKVFVACCPRDGRSPYQLAAKAQPQAGSGSPSSSADVVVFDPQMKSLYRLVEQIATSSISVLLLGETGVGKEVFARTVHRMSPRAQGPFVEINCAAISESLLESELFGHEKGAFTSAVTAKPGLFEVAHGGTLVLDEIGDMPLATQAKLLRVLEDSMIRRVGGLKSRPVDVRIVAATNSDIEARVADGTFRRDLYFRLNSATIVIPPLRERVAEIESLAREFIKRAARGTSPELAPETIGVMKDYNWPGNIRELKSVIDRAVLLCGDGPILPEHLPRERMQAVLVTRPATPAQLRRSADVPAPARGSEAERQWILAALEQSNGNQTVAARQLGISRRTLVNRLNELDVQRPRKKRGA